MDCLLHDIDTMIAESQNEEVGNAVGLSVFYAKFYSIGPVLFLLYIIFFSNFLIVGDNPNSRNNETEMDLSSPKLQTLCDYSENKSL